jgi:hypothetical protein
MLQENKIKVYKPYYSMPNTWKGSNEVNSSTNGSNEVETQLGSVISFADFPYGDLL